MASEEKKSCIVYADFLTFLAPLNLKQRGEILTLILEYISGKEVQPSDKFIEVVWLMIKTTLDRDGQKWKETKDARVESGRIGGIVRAVKAGQKVDVENIKVLQENEKIAEANGITQEELKTLCSKAGLRA